MKNVKISLFTYAVMLLLVGMQQVLLAQAEEEEQSKVKKDEVSFFDSDKEDFFSTDFRAFTLGFGVSTYLHNDRFDLPQELNNYEQLYGGSNNINLHFFRHRLMAFRKSFGLEYGLGISWMQYKFSNNFELSEGQDELIFTPLEGEFRKNKLKTTFLEVPVLLTLAPFRKKSYFLSGGVYGSLLISSKQKLKTENGSVTKNRDDFNLNQFRWGLEGRIGLGPIGFYVQYSLVELFDDNLQAELFPINIGITLWNF